MSIEGVVNVLKPPGMTSSNVVVDVRKLFDIKRVGHTGTLDPGAAGVLPVCLGRAARLFDYLVDKRKEYICEIAFGLCTDTQDSYGKVVARSDRNVTAEELQAVLPAFLGEQQQTAPMYSALKVDGQKMYELARSGGSPELRSRTITIDRLEYISQTGEGKFLLRVGCSRGTYIRMLCEDIGRQLGVCAYMSFLLRTASGPFRVENAFSIPELREMKEAGKLAQAVTPMDEAVSFYPAVHLPDHPVWAHKLLNGVPCDVDFAIPESDYLRVYGSDGRFWGIGNVNDGQLWLKLYLYTD